MIIILLWNTIYIILVHSVLICNPTENFYQLLFEGKNGLNINFELKLYTCSFN